MTSATYVVNSSHSSFALSVNLMHNVQEDHQKKESMVTH